MSVVPEIAKGKKACVFIYTRVLKSAAFHSPDKSNGYFPPIAADET